MAKVSPNPITRMDQDWGRDSTNGLPYSGAAIQKYIKDNLGEITRATFFDPGTMMIYYFASEEDRQAYIDDPTRPGLVLYSTGISFSSDLFRILLRNNNNTTTINISTNQEETILSVDFEVQTKSITDTSWRGTLDGAIITAYVDAGATGEYAQIGEPTLYTAGQTYEINVRQLLSAGPNRIRINFVDENDSSVTTSITYTVNMTEMYIEPLNNTWYLPLVEDGDVANYKFGGYRIIGSLDKYLHMDVYSGDSKVKEFVYHIGPNSYDRIEFNYTKALGLDLSTLSTGVYLVSAYLVSGSGASAIITEPVNTNIMYVATGESGSARLICINEVADRVYNYTTSRLFNYAIFNRNLMTGSPHIEVLQITGYTPTTIIDDTLTDVPTATSQPYEVSLEWITDETINLKIRANMSYGNAQTVDIPMDNSSTFPPAAGYDFYMNCGNRSNADANYLKIVSSANDTTTEYTPVWEDMVWVDGIDGWITDDIGRKCLYVRAGSKMSLPYTEYQLLNSDGITLEFCYRVSNVSDYNEPVIKIVQESAPSVWRGIQIRPTNILVHSSANSTDTDDIYQSVNLMDEEVVHFALTIYPNFQGKQDKNLVTGYINGCKNFQFEYTTGTAWATEGPLVIGADRSDVSVYFIRKYASVLSDANIQANYINSLKEVSARQEMSDLFKSVMDAKGTDISFENVKNNDKNFFIVEMLNGATIPSRANNWSKDDKGRCNLEMHYGEHPDWDWKIHSVEIAGQGTTSMNYYRWNLRWRIDKTGDGTVPVSYLSSRSKKGDSYEYTWYDAVQRGNVVFDGDGNHPNVARITAKINSASSMQSHKMGATWAYTELHDAIGLENKAQREAAIQHNPIPTVAVYQYPAYGFSKVGDTYIYIGMFTIGPDKGDLATFGYDIPTVKPSLITMEGTDHARKLVMFNSPWNEDVAFLASNECLNIVLGQDSYDKGWEIGNCYGLKPDKAVNQAAIQEILEEEFKPAYDLVFNNSTMLLGIPLNQYSDTASGTIAYINNNIGTFTATPDPYNRTTMEFYQIWIEDDYNVYYYDLKANAYLPTGANLVTEHGTPTGTTVDEKNDWFRQKRRERFMLSAENYWDIADACYSYVFLLIFGSMDNFGKNSYPVKMSTLNDGGRWGWRQDDLDSLGGIGNLGADTMPTWMEFQDSNNGAPYFGGSQSVFWNLIHECYMEDYISTTTGLTKDGILSTGKNVLSTMSSLASSGGGTLAGIMSYIKTRFWDKAQNYFPQSAYNADAAFKYEDGWLDPGYSGVSLLQSLGNHYSAEYYWFRQRMIYMMSFFKAGPFGDYSADQLGKINFRPLGWTNPTFTPFYPLYPVLAAGTTVQPTDRTWPGEPHIFRGSYGNGETDVTILATNLLSDLGDWKDIQLAPGYIQPITIQANKLITFKIGDEHPFTDVVLVPAEYYTAEEIAEAQEGDDAYGKTTNDIKTPAVYESNINTNISTLIFSGTRCLESIDARNTVSLSGIIDLSDCKRLKEAYFDGTSVTQVKFANGQPIEILSLPDAITNISMKNMKKLTYENLRMPSDLSGIELVQAENCGIDSIQLLYDIYNTDDASLRYISVTIDGIKHIDNADLVVISGLASGHDKEGDSVNYGGVTSDGAPAPTATPNIIGKIQLDTPFYMGLFEAMGLDPSSAEPYGDQGLKIASIPQLGALELIFDPSEVYIPFEDPTVGSICINTWGDGTGITNTQAAGVTSIGTTFNSNTDIVKFNEYALFGNTSVSASAFAGCTSLTEISLPPSAATIGNYAFDGCSSLQRVTFNNKYDSKNYTFRGCSSLTRIDFPTLSNFLDSTVASSDAYASPPFIASENGSVYINGEELTSVDFTGYNSVKRYQLYGCRKITSVILPNTITSIGAQAFRMCTKLERVTIPSGVTSISDHCFRNCSSLVYVDAPNTFCGGTTFHNSGDGTGIMRIRSFTRSSDNQRYWYFKKIVVTGNISHEWSSGYGLGGVSLEAIWFQGTINFGSIPIMTSNSRVLKFVEFAKTVSCSSMCAESMLASGCIVHLAYSEGVACTPAIVQASSGYINKIYVGPGDPDVDAAVLQMYENDPNWSANSTALGKLAKWSDYLAGDNPEYAAPPTFGEEEESNESNSD